MAVSQIAFIASQRFGLGPKQRDLSALTANPKNWLRKQVRLGQQTSLNLQSSPTDQLVREHVRIPRDKRPKTPEARREHRKLGRKIYEQEIEARFNLALATEQPFIERLVQFWSNHFTVSYSNLPQLAAIVGAYEREVIRPHVLGRFSDMLLASTQHPAMLLYLNNASSIGPNSQGGKRRNRGLNENLGREILELHTLGVNGGYDQNDVIALAKIITGWTIAPVEKNGGGFQFIKFMHEPGTQILLEKPYKDNGIEQGVEALNDLANHPSTAKFIATKLVRHFVDDKPPARAVRKIEQVFLKTGGDLQEVALALIDLNEAWDNPSPKIKTPYELMISSLRLIGQENTKLPFKKITQSMRLFDHIPFSASSPAGWSDISDDWISPNAMINRIEWCQTLSQVTTLDQSPSSIAEEVLPRITNSSTHFWIERAPSAKEGLALLLASPEWQRR